MSIELPDFNAVLHDGVLEIIGSIDIEGIPVGGILSKIIGMLWTGPDPSQANWDKLKKYAEAMVEEKIDKERLNALDFRLHGYASIAHAYKRTSMGSAQKGQHLTVLLDTLRLFHKDFWDDRNPEKMFPLYSTYGTLWIGALSDQAFNYKQIYLQDDPDAADHLEEFRTNVAQYVANAQVMYDRLHAWRFSKLELKEYQSSDLKLIGMNYTSTWTFTDKYDGYTKQSVNSDMNNSSFHAPQARALMEREQRDRVSAINNDYVKGLQETLAVCRLWQYLEQGAMRPLSGVVIDDQGPWGGDKNLAHDFADRPPIGSRITQVAIRTEQFVEGVQLSYDGKPGGWHGNNQRGSLQEMALDADEIIVEVSGKSSSLIDAIAFKTSKGRMIQGGGGGSSNPAFSATGRAGWKQTSLHSISGWTDGKRVTGLQLQWKHFAELSPYTPSYKTTGPLPLAKNLHLKAPNGKFISGFVNEYSGKAASNEYFPLMGDGAVALQFISPSNAATLADGDFVQIRTTEDGVGGYNLLSRFTTVQTYYYLPNYGNRQLWAVIKVIPSDGPILTGDKVRLRNMEDFTYLWADGDDRYVVSIGDPFDWEVVVA